MKMKGQQGKILTLKFLVLGGVKIGKSDLVKRYVDNSVYNYYIPTIGSDIRLKRLEINDTDINITIFEPATRYQYRSIVKMFYKGADGILVGFDLTEPNTFVDVDYWM